jgi:hypothetical protein
VSITVVGRGRVAVVPDVAVVELAAEGQPRGFRASVGLSATLRDMAVTVTWDLA